MTTQRGTKQGEERSFGVSEEVKLEDSGTTAMTNDREVSS
jgi:hypothetical protein